MSTKADPVALMADAIADRIIERLVEFQPAAASKRLLSLKEAGSYMGGKTGDAIRHMVNAGIIPANAVKRFGARRIFIDKIELDKWISAQ